MLGSAVGNPSLFSLAVVDSVPSACALLWRGMKSIRILEKQSPPGEADEADAAGVAGFSDPVLT